jgi:hypothetical protein
MKMVLKPFWRRTRPDNSQKKFRNPYTVAGYVVDQWRRMAYGGVALGVAGLGLAGGAWGYAIYKEMPQPPHYTIVDPKSGHIRTYSGDLDPVAQDEVYGAVLRNAVRELREIPGKESDAKKRMERAVLFFADRGGIKLRKRLDDIEWSKPIIRRGPGSFSSHYYR